MLACAGEGARCTPTWLLPAGSRPGTPGVTCKDAVVTGPVFRAAPQPVRFAFWSLAIVVLIGALNLLLGVVWGGTPGIGVVFFALAIFAVLGVRRVAEGHANARMLVTVIGLILAAYRLFVSALLLGLPNAGSPGWAVGVAVAQLVLEVVLIVAALVLLFRPEVSAYVRAAGMKDRPTG